jgi:hypothetical protein
VRVLLLSTASDWTPGERLLATLASGLAARGDVMAFACARGTEVERAIEQAWPRLTMRAVTGHGLLRRLASLRGIVTAIRPDAMLVAHDNDAVLAAMAMGARGGVVRRVGLHERQSRADTVRLGAVARMALARTRLVRWGDVTPAVSWPSPLAPAADADASDEVHRLLVAPAPHLLIVPDAQHGPHTADALRGAAHLRTRHPDLRITLFGAVHELQATRLHASALGLGACVQVESLDRLLLHDVHGAAAAWVAAGGDSGAIATLAAMQMHLPVVVPQDAPFAELVLPQVTGLHAAPDNTAPVAADLSRLLGDTRAWHTIGDAAAARAQRLYHWEHFVDQAAEQLAQVSGIAAARVTMRPSLTPA